MITLEKFIYQVMKHHYGDGRTNTVEMPEENFKWAIEIINKMQDKIHAYEQGLDEIANEGIGYGKLIAEKTLELFE